MENMNLCPCRYCVRRHAGVVAGVVGSHAVDLQPPIQLSRHLATKADPLKTDNDTEYGAGLRYHV